MYFVFTKREKEAIRPNTLRVNINPGASCGREEGILKSCIAGFKTSGIDRKSTESEAQQEETVTALRASWAQRRKHGKQSNHTCCAL